MTAAIDRLPARVRAKIELTAPPAGRPVVGPCWTWRGRLQGGGYGECGSRRLEPSRLMHRYTYRLTFGDIPGGLHVDHLCRNRACCNPCHLEAVTPRVNSLRGVRGSQTHCARAGHEYTPENTIVREGKFGPRRQCRACTYVNVAERVQKQQTEGLRAGDPRHGSIHGYMGFGCRCDECRAAYSDHWQRTKEAREAERLAIDAKATRCGHEWTGPELEMVARTDLPAKRVAEMLSRTVAGVRNKRKALKVDPRAKALAGVA